MMSPVHISKISGATPHGVHYAQRFPTVARAEVGRPVLKRPVES
jgi:hypothetical protein